MKCINLSQVWLWQLNTEFCQSLVIKSIMLNWYQNKNNENNETSEENSAIIFELLIALHCDLYHFTNWLEYEFIPCIKYQSVKPLCFTNQVTTKIINPNTLNKNQLKPIELIHKIVESKLETFKNLVHDIVFKEKLIESLIISCRIHLVNVETFQFMATTYKYYIW